jgi:hypothetical protein
MPDPARTTGTRHVRVAINILDALLGQLAERAISGRVRSWAASLLGGEAAASSAPEPSLKPPRRRRKPEVVDYYP